MPARDEPTHATAASPLYVFTTPRNEPGAEEALAVFTKTYRGWRARSTRHDALSHDYVSREAPADLLDWIERSGFGRIQTVFTREEAIRRLARGGDRATRSLETASGAPWKGCTVEEADAALRPLE